MRRPSEQARAQPRDGRRARAWAELALWGGAVVATGLPWPAAGGLASEPARWWSAAGLGYGLWLGLLAGGAARRRESRRPRRRRPRAGLLALLALAGAVGLADAWAGPWWSLVALRAATALAAGFDVARRVWPVLRPDARIRAEEEEPDIDPHPRRRRAPPGAAGSAARPWERS